MKGSTTHRIEGLVQLYYSSKSASDMQVNGLKSIAISLQYFWQMEINKGHSKEASSFQTDIWSLHTYTYTHTHKYMHTQS